jgi:hypothetical protein
MADYSLPESRKHNLRVELSRIADYRVGDRFEDDAGVEIEITDFAFRFVGDEFVYWITTTDERDGTAVSESTIAEWTQVATADEDEYIDPGFEAADRSDDRVDELGPDA